MRHADNGGFHKMYFSPSFRSFLALSLVFVGDTLCNLHKIKYPVQSPLSSIPTRFHLKAKRVVTKESSQHGGRRDAGFVIVSFIKRLNKYDR